MLRPVDHERRNGPLYPGAGRTLPDCFDANHLLRRIDAAFDFPALTAGLERHYHPRLGRPPIHPEIVVRALVLMGIYHVPSVRQLCERISENLAWRWFCCLTLEDAVFDHSSISVFLDRVGSEDLQQLLATLNGSLADAGLLSDHVYIDSSLIAANVRTQDLHPRDPEDDPPTPSAEEGVWEAREATGPDEDGIRTIRLQRYQDAQGTMPLPHHDLDARWRTIRNRTILGYLHHVLGERGGFILAQTTTAATVADTAAAVALLDQVPISISTLAADTNYRAGEFRFLLARRGITAYIPLDAKQAAPSPPGFIDCGDCFICPTGTLLLPRGVPDEDMSVRYVARAADCAACPMKPECVSPSRKAKALWASRYRVATKRAKRLNSTYTYEREQRWRTTVAEGIFARLDRLGGTRARYRGRDRVEQQETLAALAHNILKAMTKRRFWSRNGAVAPCPQAPATQLAHCTGVLCRLLIPHRAHLTLHHALS